MIKDNRRLLARYDNKIINIVVNRGYVKLFIFTVVEK